MQVQEISTSNMPVPRRFPTIDSNNLFAVSREIRINHEGEEYRLFAFLHSLNQIYFFGGLRWSNHNFSIIK